MKVNILGTEYKIIMEADSKDYPLLKSADGYCDHSIKEIVITKLEKEIGNLDDLEDYKRKVLRHEIIHAFFYESGLWNNSEFGNNEELTDWIAIQFEKILGVFINAKAINSIDIDLAKEAKAFATVKAEDKSFDNNTKLEENNVTPPDSIVEKLTKTINGQDIRNLATDGFVNRTIM